MVIISDILNTNVNKQEEPVAQQPPTREPTKLQNIIATVVAVLVIVALIIGVVKLVQHARSKPRPYTLTPPTSWQRVSPTPPGASIAFSAHKEEADATGALSPYIVVQAQNLSQDAQKLRFDQLANTYIAQIAQHYQAYTQVKLQSTKIENLSAVFLTFTFVQDGANVTADSLFIVKDGISYTVNGEAMSSAWTQEGPTIQKSILTFMP